MARDIIKTSLQKANVSSEEAKAIAQTFLDIKYEFTNDPTLSEFIPDAEQLTLAIADSQTPAPEGVTEATPPPLCHSPSMMS